jgi:hypothetical protein
MLHPGLFATVSLSSLMFQQTLQTRSEGAMNCGQCLRSTPFCEVFCNKPYCLCCDFAVCQFCFLTFMRSFSKHPPDDSGNLLAAVLHVGSLVSCHNCLTFLLCFKKRSMASTSYFRSKIVVLLAYNLYAELQRLQSPVLLYQPH